MRNNCVRYLIDHALVEAPHGRVGGEEFMAAIVSGQLAGTKHWVGIGDAGVRTIDRRRILGVSRKKAWPRADGKIVAEDVRLIGKKAAKC